MSDRKTNTEGQSDSTVMLRVDDAGNPVSDAAPAPQPGQSDSTVLGMQMPNFDDDHPTQDEVPSPVGASNADKLRSKPLAPAAAEPSQPPKRATGMRQALPN